MDAFRAERSSRVKAGIADVRFIDDNRHKIAWRAARQARCRARTFATAGRDAIEEAHSHGALTSRRNYQTVFVQNEELPFRSGPLSLSASSPESAARGRPRDASIEARVFDAAMAVYAEGGWAAFSFEAVARRSGVGKASLYRRWAGRGELLRQTFEARWLAVTRIDTGNLRRDLRALARMVAQTLTGPFGGAHPRISLDLAEHPELLAFLRPYAEATIAQGRHIIRRAIVRGELSAAVNPGLIMDLVVGGVTNHVRTTPPRLRQAMLAKIDGFIDSIVEVVLAGVGAETLPVRASSRGRNARER